MRLSTAGGWMLLLTLTAFMSLGCNSGGDSGSTSGAGGGVFSCDSTGVDLTSDRGPTVEIMEPAEGSSYKTTAVVPLVGAATDKFDGNITSPLQMRWSRDFSDPTEGPKDQIDPAKDPPLSVGMHAISLTVVDSKCLVGVRTVNIDVTP
jgi:hypothetical protein